MNAPDRALLEMARAVAGEYVRRHPNMRDQMDDVLSDAAFGVAQAAGRYDDSRGATLKTYAVHRARGAIIDGVRVRGRLTRKESAEGVTMADLPAWRQMPRSVDEVRDAVGVEPGQVEPGYAQVDAEDQVAFLMAGLSQRHLTLLRWRYWEDLTLSEIGRRFQVSESRVSQMHAEILRKMRRWAAECSS